MAYSAPDRIAELEAEVETLRYQLDGLLGTEMVCPIEKMTPASFRIVNLLARRSPQTVPHHALYYAMNDDFEQLLDPNNNLKAHISRARTVLNPVGVELETVWGLGYRMTPESKSKWQTLLDQANGLGRAA